MAKFVGESVEVAGSGLGIPADLIGGVEVLELELDSSDVPMDEENPLDKDLPQAGEKTMNNVEEKSHLSLCQEARAFAQDNNLVDAIATMEKAISIAPKSTQRGWKKELEKWRNELDAAAIETDTQSGAAALDVDEVQSTPNTLIAVSPRVRAVMEGFGLAQIFTIPNDAPTDEVVEILFKLMFERLQVALKAKKERSDEERKALWGAMRFPLGLLVENFPGGLRKKMYKIVDEARMSPRKVNAIVRNLSFFKFFFDYDKEWYQTCFEANLADARSTAVIGAQQEDFLAMEATLGSAVKAIEGSEEVVNTKAAKDLSAALQKFLQSQADAEKAQAQK